MFTLTIKTRDYIAFTINGNATDLLTAVTLVRSGLQARQDITATVAKGDMELGTFTIPTAHSLVHMVEALMGGAA